MIARIPVLCVLVAACSSSTERQTVQLDALRFDVPDGWQRTDTQTRDSSTAVWTPSDNARMETVAVIRSHRPATANADAATLERLLVGAQRGLANARVAKVTSFTSARGLSGARVEVDYVPESLRSSYHRVHAVLVDGTDVITVLYTARIPDASLEAFNMVVASIRREEG